jgi:hypothetical protein
VSFDSTVFLYPRVKITAPTEESATPTIISNQTPLFDFVASLGPPVLLVNYLFIF